MFDTQRAGSWLARLLEDYLLDWSARTGTGVEIWALPKGDASSHVAEVVLATVAHALDEVERHAEADQVSIAVTVGRSGLRLTVSDDGCGFRPDVPDQGLVRIKAHFAALGGDLWTNSVPGAGTTVSGAIPAKSMTAAAGE